ncbi:NAD-dependent epimerase/dehydratase family protein [Aurantimonas sp. A2-1-M11]|uniref:NAD-dependent epimerase/dehydratase family protein n=1 Tax=Aurantimonas sp. A2-1-M11 TaxID=3113712 RepID=UPI002F9404BF
MRILLTGSSGFVGRRLKAALTASGHEVVVLRRGGPAGDGVYVAPADHSEIMTTPDWPAGIDAVGHLAAANPERGTANAADIEALMAVNRDGTAALARRAAAEGVRRMVCVSTANVHAASSGPVSETSPIAPQSAYARSKHAGEVAFWEALAESSTSGCVLRPAPVFGVGGRGGIAALARLARTQLPLPLGGFSALRSLVAVDDLVRAIMLSLDGDEAAGETFLVAGDPPMSTAGIIAALRRGLGRSPRLIPVPPALARRLASLAGREAMVATLDTPFVVDAGHLRETLGWAPARTTHDALAALSAETPTNRTAEGRTD